MDEPNYGKLFSKINTNNRYLIFRFLDLFDITELSYVNKSFKVNLREKYSKSIFMITSSLKVYKSYIQITSSNDFAYYLKNNSHVISKDIKGLIRNIVDEYYTRIPIMKHFFSKISFPNLSVINLKGKEIGKKSMKYLSYYLQYNNMIDTLIISENKINGPVLEPLISTKKSINKIKANRCIIDNSSMRNLSLINYSSLIAKNCNIDSFSIAHLHNVNITELNLANNQINCDGVYSICKNIPNLTKLNLSSNNLTDISILYLGCYLKSRPFSKPLLKLSIHNNKITTAGLMAILVLLKDVTVSQIHAGIHMFDISYNIIDSLPKRIKDIPHIGITHFNIGGHNFTMDDLSNLIDFINLNQSIQSIDLSGIFFDNVSLHLMFNKLNHNTNLTEIKVNNCYLGNTEIDNSLLSFYTHTSSNKINQIEMKNNFITLNNNFTLILRNNYLTYLNLEGNDLNIYENELPLFFDAIASNTSLRVLNLNNNYLKKQASYLLLKLSEEGCKSCLEILSLKQNQISHLTIELTNLLLNNKHLTETYLDNNDIGDEIASNYFFHNAKLTSMKLLNLCENKISLLFLKKCHDYYISNGGVNNVKINIFSKMLLDEYDKQNNKDDLRLILKTYNITAL
jgi:hypothetical protein